MEKREVAICGVVAVLGAISAATGFGAEATRIKRFQVVRFNSTDPTTLCTYPGTPASDLGFTSVLCLIVAIVIINVASGCICCRKGPALSWCNRLVALACFLGSWVTFLVAILLLLMGVVLSCILNGQTIDVGSSECHTVKRGLFSVGSWLSLTSVAAGIVCYRALNSTGGSAAAVAAANQEMGIAVRQPQIPTQTAQEKIDKEIMSRRQFT